MQTGFVAPWLVESSWTGDQTLVSRVDRQFLSTVPPGKSQVGFLNLRELDLRFSHLPGLDQGSGICVSSQPSGGAVTAGFYHTFEQQSRRGLI